MVDDAKYEQWLADEGRRYRLPVRPRNWLGGEPPTPISDKLRTTIYNDYISNPTVYDVRKLSERYGISMQRVDAILRLKGLEDHWKQKKPLQTGFLAGMEEILGVKQDAKMRLELNRGAAELGEDASEADQVSDSKADNLLRERYQRFFWEPVVEGQEPVVSASIERERIERAKHARETAATKSKQAMLPRRTAPEEHVASVPGRAAITFVNVGTKFVDVDDRMRRLKEAERRSKLKKKRAVKSEQEKERAAQ
ncbi:eukaryotic mitochondrial regulator protein-domain-containing protein [Amylocystis lapponica]|nr:eukaryotic mitochondrial regulator protein-domain-containing protein [Amylocystis lapponica]